MPIQMNDNNNSNDKIISDINMTPLIDIMLVLLIIFMVTSSVSLESGLDIDLPKTKSQTSSQEGKAVLVSLDRHGAISVQGKEVDLAGLKDAISEALHTDNTSLVVFEGDKNSNLGKTIQIMDVAKIAGAKKFAIATEGNN
ncbi:MAG: biopolymer transporter ExbD [Bacteriovoracaceae bacterium]|nr:biopolymer transporter ExbD [Bacteriovoracaceae bacterium]